MRPEQLEAARSVAEKLRRNKTFMYVGISGFALAAALGVCAVVRQLRH